MTWSGFKYATPRDPSRATDGGRIAKLAATIGKPGMPWQREVWDVATERDSEGRLVYELVLVTVPRQSGKTTLYGPVQLDRVIMNAGIKTFYTAQTGKDARSRFGDLVTLVQGSALHAVAKYRYSAGDEGIMFPNGSALKIFAPVEAALHGETPPLVGMDEIWEYDEALGDALLEGAIIPAQITLYGQRQVWLMSTAGTALSTFMRKWVDRGRESVAKPGSWPRFAYFEAGLPEGADPYDPDDDFTWHPAIEMQGVESLREARENVSRPTWIRAFCNLWLEASDPLWSVEHWSSLGEGVPAVPSRRELAITYAVSVNGDQGVVMASWRDAVTGRPCSRVLHAAPGTTWMVEFIAKLWREWKPAVLGADDGGPTRRVTDQLRRKLGDDAITTTGGVEFSTACMSWVELVNTNELWHDGSKTLSNAVAHLVLARRGDLTRFDRGNSTGPIAGAEASAVGVWLYDHRGADVPAPFILS